MKRKWIVAGIVLSLVIGCATGVVIHDQLTPYVYAQEDMASPQYKNCMVVQPPETHPTQYLNSGQAPDMSKTVQVPPGWTPIGGGGNVYRIIMCK